MVSTWSSGCPALSGSEYYEGGETSFQFVDFLPTIQEKGGIFTPDKYQTFRTLVDRANEWLRENKKWKIITCESVEFKSNGKYADSSQMTYMKYGERITYYVRGLRLWIAERNEEIETEQQIGYLNLVPNQTESGGLFSVGKYETLDTLIDNFNALLHTNPLPGRVITIESQEMKASSNFDPDRSNWRERGDFSKQFLIILRIFYEVMTGDPEEIGVKDFVPDQVSSGGIFSMPQYEPASNVVRKASLWCSQQQNIRFCNAQSIEIKVKRGNTIDTQRTSYTEYGKRLTYYVRILRIAYTKPPANVNLPNEMMSQLTCKTFTPVQTGPSFLMPTFENLYETKARISAWVKATGARIISAETVSIGMQSVPDASISTQISESFLFIIRLYMDGVYKEPPPEMLPPLPAIERSCCAIL